MSRVNSIINTFPNISAKTILLLSKKDPSKNNAYLAWMVKQFANSKKIKEITELVESFHKNKQNLDKKDLYQYDWDSLKNSLSKSVSKRKLKNQAKESGTVTIVDNDQVKIIALLTFAAAKQYCANTKWCISDPGTFYEYYLDDHILVAIPKQSPKNKIAILISRNKTSRDIQGFTAENYEIDNMESIFPFLNFSVSMVDSNKHLLLTEDSILEIVKIDPFLEESPKKMKELLQFLIDRHQISLKELQKFDCWDQLDLKHFLPSKVEDVPLNLINSINFEYLVKDKHNLITAIKLAKKDNPKGKEWKKKLESLNLNILLG